jgi:hypothetical protein
MKSLLGVILVGVAIFGYAEVCNAQCAWVLWGRTTIINLTPQGQKIEKPIWELLSAFPNHEQCTEYKIKKIAETKEFMGRTSNVQKMIDIDNGIMVRIEVNESLTSGVIKSLEAQCLPDTIDPRK